MQFLCSSVSFLQTASIHQSLISILLSGFATTQYRLLDDNFLINFRGRKLKRKFSIFFIDGCFSILYSFDAISSWHGIVNRLTFIWLWGSPHILGYLGVFPNLMEVCYPRGFPRFSEIWDKRDEKIRKTCCPANPGLEELVPPSWRGVCPSKIFSYTTRLRSTHK